MTISYSFRPEDFVQWCLYETQYSRAARKTRLLNIVFSDIAYFVVALFVSEHVQKLWVTATALGFSVAFCILTPAYIDRRIKTAFQKHASSDNMRGCFGPHKLTINEEGLLEEAPAGKSMVGWQAVSDVIAEPDYVFIRLTTGQAAVINQKSYSGPIPFKEVPEAIRTHCQRHAAQGAAPSSGPATPI